MSQAESQPATLRIPFALHDRLGVLHAEVAPVRDDDRLEVDLAPVFHDVDSPFFVMGSNPSATEPVAWSAVIPLLRTRFPRWTFT